jgi:addiction module HigA family antidote
MTVKNRMRPIHPGEILREEFLGPLGMSANQLALRLRVAPNRVSSILNGSRAVTAETALRLSRYFRTTADFWLNLQMAYELRVAEEAHGARIEHDVQPAPLGKDAGPRA